MKKFVKQLKDGMPGVPFDMVFKAMFEKDLIRYADFDELRAIQIYNEKHKAFLREAKRMKKTNCTQLYLVMTECCKKGKQFETLKSVGEFYYSIICVTLDILCRRKHKNAIIFDTIK